MCARRTPVFTLRCAVRGAGSAVDAEHLDGRRRRGRRVTGPLAGRGGQDVLDGVFHYKNHLLGDIALRPVALLALEVEFQPPSANAIKELAHTGCTFLPNVNGPNSHLTIV